MGNKGCRCRKLNSGCSTPARGSELPVEPERARGAEGGVQNRERQDEPGQPEDQLRDANAVGENLRDETPGPGHEARPEEKSAADLTQVDLFGPHACPLRTFCIGISKVENPDSRLEDMAEGVGFGGFCCCFQYQNTPFPRVFKPICVATTKTDS